MTAVPYITVKIDNRTFTLYGEEIDRFLSRVKRFFEVISLGIMKL